MCPNTPAFLESIFGIGAAGAVNVGNSYPVMVVILFRLTSSAINYRLKTEDIAYIFDHAEVDMIIADEEYKSLLDGYHKNHPKVPIIVDTDLDATEGELSGPFDAAVLEGLEFDKRTGNKGWSGLTTQVEDEEDMIALAYTSGTTARPKGVVYTHRGAYLAALANVIESGLNYHSGRCGYLWTLPMFHAMGKLCLILRFECSVLA